MVSDVNLHPYIAVCEDPEATAAAADTAAAATCVSTTGGAWGKAVQADISLTLG